MLLSVRTIGDPSALSVRWGSNYYISSKRRDRSRSTTPLKATRASGSFWRGGSEGLWRHCLLNEVIDPGFAATPVRTAAALNFRRICCLSNAASLGKGQIHDRTDDYCGDA